MKAKLLAVLSCVKSICSKIYNLSPFTVGVAIGYVFKPEIKLTIDLIAKLVKHFLG